MKINYSTLMLSVILAVLLGIYSCDKGTVITDDGTIDEDKPVCNNYKECTDLQVGYCADSILDVITNASTGLDASDNIADGCALVFADATWIYFHTSNSGIYMVSTDDGFNIDKSTLTKVMSSGLGMPRVYAFDGRYRMYGSGGINYDGINYEGLLYIDGEEATDFSTSVPTVVFEYSEIPNLEEDQRTTGPSIVQLEDKTYRMYFSTLPIPGAGTGPEPMWIYSASSPDMNTWTLDEGIRIGKDAASLTGSAEHPYATLNENGKVMLWYFRNDGGAGVFLAESDDEQGLTFTTECMLHDQFYADHFIGVNAKGESILYFGYFDPSTNSGGIKGVPLKY